MTRKTVTRWCAGVLLIGIVSAESGCRRRDPYTDGVLEITRAEKMDLEDQIYALEDKLAEKERELDSLRARKPGSSVPAPRALRTTPPAAVMPDEDLVPPSIDPGVPVEPKIELPPIEATPSKSTPRVPLKPASRALKPPAPALNEAIAPPDVAEEVTEEPEVLPAPNDVSQASFRQPIATAEVDDPRVTSLFINPFQTMGVELDQQPGDDGIMLLCEPRNEAGQFVAQAGRMTVAVLDPAIEGDGARIARWELSKTEVSQRMLDARPERGIKVQLKWPENRPEHGKLKLFVRYHTPDGRQIETASDVFVALPGQISQRWTPRQQP